MFEIMRKTLKYKRLTQDYPNKSPNVKFFICNPEVNSEKCNLCGKCELVCPTKAIKINNESKTVGFNHDECIVCVACEDVCPHKAINMTNKIDIAKTERKELRHTPIIIKEEDISNKPYEVILNEVESKIKKYFKRSLNIREVDAGSCNACDYEINALNNPFNDVERLGIHFVASPRHADMLLVTGALTRNMELALIKTYNATPDPKLVVAIGACACSGGIFKDSYATKNGIDRVLPVDVYVPGCPPRPQAIIYGILKAIES